MPVAGWALGLTYLFLNKYRFSGNFIDRFLIRVGKNSYFIYLIQKFYYLIPIARLLPWYIMLVPNVVLCILGAEIFHLIYSRFGEWFKRKI